MSEFNDTTFRIEDNLNVLIKNLGFKDSDKKNRELVESIKIDLEYLRKLNYYAKL